MYQIIMLYTLSILQFYLSAVTSIKLEKEKTARRQWTPRVKPSKQSCGGGRSSLQQKPSVVSGSGPPPSLWWQGSSSTTKATHLAHVGLSHFSVGVHLHSACILPSVSPWEPQFCSRQRWTSMTKGLHFPGSFAAKDGLLLSILLGVGRRKLCFQDSCPFPKNKRGTLSCPTPFDLARPEDSA